MILEIISLIVGVLGILFGLRCYYELWKWARQCQHARIAVEFKRKVKLDRPLVEWLSWANQLENDKAANGHVVYMMGGTRIAVMKPGKRPGKVQQAIRYARRRKSTAPPRTGKLSGVSNGS